MATGTSSSFEGRTVVVTGSASGMGAATMARLRADGDRVIGVDLRDAEVIADLSTPAGRRHAVAEILRLTDGRLDGLVCAAGLGPVRGRERLILEVNFSGAVELIEGLHRALARAGTAKVVVIGSNSTTTTPLVPRAAVRALLAGDPERAQRRVRWPATTSAPFSYAASKLALTSWVREQAVEPRWIGAGVRLNVLAPGAIATPMLSEQLSGPDAGNVKRFPIPAGNPAGPELIAEWTAMLLSPAADYLVGSIVTVDGGSEALFRATDWPRPVPLRAMPRFLRLMFGRRH